MARKQLHSLTALKGLFIFIIVFHNTLAIQPLFDWFPGSSFIILFGGQLGNSMFFILSGFLLTYSYRERIAAGTLAFRDYLLRRLKKLYPLYFLSNIASVIISIAKYGMSAISLEKIAMTFLLQIGGGLKDGNPYNSPTWFVSALFVCYIAFFVLCYYSKNSTQYYGAIAFGIAWGYTLMQAQLSIPFCYAENGTAFLNFFIGCALAEIYPRIRVKTHKWLQPVSIISLLFSVFLLLRYGVEIICGDTHVAFAFVICPLILYLAFSDGLCSKILQLKPFVGLGRISTSVFFWHLVIYYLFCMLLEAVIPGGQLQESHYLVYILLLLMGSLLSHRLLEKNRH